ncbi:MAG: class I SAM-dependent methyltransferase [Nitrospirota bacterium]
MEKVSCSHATDVSYWNGYSQWYRLWFEHNNYHDSILVNFLEMVKPGWKVLDIGAGNGVLSLPLCAIGCEVSALEPSLGMRNLLHKEASKRGINWIRVDNRRWEEFHDFSVPFDLVIACNSLHLTTLGLEDSLKKILSMKPLNVFIVSELQLDNCSRQFLSNQYAIAFTKKTKTESSFAYHSIHEAIEHWSYKNKRFPNPNEEKEMRSKLIWRHNHFWMQDMVTVNMLWWHLNVQDKMAL